MKGEYMDYLLFFLAGVVFIQWAFPILDEICTTIVAAIEVVKSCCAVKIAEKQAEVIKLNPDACEEEHAPMGFQFTPAIGTEIEPEEEEEGEEDE